jgi:Cu2+-exporting ATPase
LMEQHMHHAEPSHGSDRADTGAGQASASSHHAHMVGDFRRRFWVCLVITAPILFLSPLIQDALGIADKVKFSGQLYVLLALSCAVYFYGGWPFLKGMVDELRKHEPGMMTLVAVAISVAFIYSAAVVLGLNGEVLFWELATLIDIMLLGHWLEMRSVMGASRALEKLVELLPRQAHLILADGEIRDVMVESINSGDRVLVKPGEKVPVDGKVEETSVDLSMLTGESRPVPKGPGDELIGGAINGEGAVEMVIERTGADTYLSQVIGMVRKAQESRSHTQDLANRAALWLTIVAIGGGLITLLVWLVIGKPLDFSLQRSVTVMVICCPHALGLAIPLVVAVSTSLSAQNGLLIRDRTAFERSRLLQALVFDKTGTLTKGSFGVTDIVSLNGDMDSRAILELAAAVESRSEHTIARGVVEEARRQGLQTITPEGFVALPGRGARARVNDQDVAVVSPGYLEQEGLSTDNEELDEVIKQGKTVIYLLVDGELKGAIALADMVRDESREAISTLQGMGIRCMMLTGDSRQVAQWVSGELGLDEFFAEVLPHEKSQHIEELKERGLVVGMVGDGVNDAPALVTADVGIAIGAGTDVAVESADIVLVRDDPRDVAAILQLGKATYRKMVQNLGWATGYNVFAIPLAAGVLYPVGILLTPAIGAALMSLSTIIVAFNARRLKIPGSIFKERGA